MAAKTHDFFVFYYEDDDLAHRFVQHFVRRWESEFKLRGLYLDRDAVIGKNKFTALQDDIDRSQITVVVFTKGFMNNPSGFQRYANTAVFSKLLKSISNTPRYIPIAVGLEHEELPDCIRDVISVASFPEYDWDQQVKLWRQLDNVLVENELLNNTQISNLGSTYKRYIRPAEKLLNDKFLRDHVASKICHEYFGLGIGLNIPHTRLEQIKRIDSDPFTYIFKMLITWREDCEQNRMTEDAMLEALLDGLKDVERHDIRENVCFYAEEFRKKEQHNREERRLEAEKQEAELRRYYEQRAAQQQNGANVNNNTSNGDSHSTLRYPAQEEEGNEQTSVMKVVDTPRTVPNRPPSVQGYVPLHAAAPTRYDASENQVTLAAGSLIPTKTPENEMSEGIFPQSVPSWTLPVAMGTTAAVAVAVTAFVCLRYKS